MKVQELVLAQQQFNGSLKCISCCKLAFVPLQLKQQEMGQELKAQITAKSEEISILQTQVDVLQHDRDVLQPVNQYIIKTQLEHSQINFLEAKLMRVEFLEGVSSHEVDQLREGLMDNIAEIHHLRMELKDTLPTDTLPPTSSAG